MASKNGGRSTGDERPEDEPIDEIDDELDEDDLDEDDLDEDEDEDDADELDDDDLEEEDDLEDEDDLDEEPVGAGTSRSAGRASGSKVASARAKAVPRSTKKDEARPGLIGRFVNFIREIVAELQKVIWPTRKELLTYTTVVVVFVAIMMTFVAGLDYGFARLMFFVFGNKTTT